MLGIQNGSFKDNILGLLPDDLKVDYKDDKDNTIAHYIAQYGCSDALFKAIKAEADFTKTNQNGDIPLIAGIKLKGPENIIGNIMDDMTLLDLTRKYSKDNTIAHYLAAYNCSQFLFNKLKDKKVNLDLPNELKQTAIIIALLNGNKDAVKSLINSGAKIDAQDKDGNTVLHHLSKCDVDEDLFNKLRSDPGIDFNKPNNIGKTPYMMGVLNKNKNVINELAKISGIKVNEKGNNGNTAAHYCMRIGGDKDLFDTLEKKWR